VAAALVFATMEVVVLAQAHLVGQLIIGDRVLDNTRCTQQGPGRYTRASRLYVMYMTGPYTVDSTNCTSKGFCVGIHEHCTVAEILVFCRETSSSHPNIEEM
jgi:hypothetical protein